MNQSANGWGSILVLVSYVYLTNPGFLGMSITQFVGGISGTLYAAEVNEGKDKPRNWSTKNSVNWGRQFVSY